MFLPCLFVCLFGLINIYLTKKKLRKNSSKQQDQKDELRQIISAVRVLLSRYRSIQPGSDNSKDHWSGGTEKVFEMEVEWNEASSSKNLTII